ncbi:hypothetical protein WOC76_09840 [Methylocystis sp. IM3]|uniref:hypothetical protein n=1 Tax=unclassified Methylocystis TaxID=2625913 RepID=UPI0030F59848
MNFTVYHAGVDAVSRLVRAPGGSLEVLRASPSDPYKISRAYTLLHRLACAAPPALRERLAEKWLRRPEAPGPAAEHVLQYAIGAQLAGADRDKTAVVAKGADNFYRRQYRQYLNPTMGVFAQTATLAILGAGSRPRGGLWGRRREVVMAASESIHGAGPILVLDHQTVATPLFLPRLGQAGEQARLERWLSGRGPAPASYRRLMAGEAMRSAESRVRARRRGALGASLEVAQAALESGKLAILALHPYDPDAMGLHVTLFGVEALTPDELLHDYALAADELEPWRRAADRMNAELRFLVGGVEEAFTQCSQNLFVKRPAAPAPARAAWPHAWSPSLPLDLLVGAQFEIFQATVSASGLPGVSPRNGDIGLAGFVAQKGRRTFVLIPYFTGNAVHGHAAKLWSNPHSALLIYDDHTTRSATTLYGPTRVVSHDRVERQFPLVAARIASRRRRNGAPADTAEYWFIQQVTEVRVQDEPVVLNHLDPARPTCTIHAAGPAHHGKKPAYFAAESAAPYDMAWQHEREAEGRPRDPSGVSRRYWQWESGPALEARRVHLDGVGATPAKAS